MSSRVSPMPGSTASSMAWVPATGRFPAGTGIAHCFLNNTEDAVRLLIIGERHPRTGSPIPLTGAPCRAQQLDDHGTSGQA